jgi:3-oxoacyl-[acyl-carrier protein] reductase
MSRSIVITGTRKGLGKAMATHFLEQGWLVAGCSRGKSSIEHSSYHHYSLDVSDEEEVAAMVRGFAKACGRLDALINNAGIAAMNHLVTTPLTTARSVLETNVLGSFVVMREAAKQMRKSGGGRIVNLSSVAVPLDLEGEALYAASKSAVETLTRIAARELATWGITVNAVGPGPVATGLIAGVPKERINALVERQAIKRMVTEDDVINAVAFFLREESAMVSGQVLYLGGV